MTDEKQQPQEAWTGPMPAPETMVAVYAMDEHLRRVARGKAEQFGEPVAVGAVDEDNGLRLASTPPVGHYVAVSRDADGRQLIGYLSVVEGADGLELREFDARP